MFQRLLRRGETRDGLVGIFVFQFVEREGERAVERECLGDRFRRVLENARHLVGGFEVALGIDGKPAAGGVDRQVLADAGEHVLQFAAVGMVIEHVVDGDQRHAGLPRQRGALAEPRAVVAAIEHAAASRTRPGAAAQRRWRKSAFASPCVSLLLTTNRSLAFEGLSLATCCGLLPPPLAGEGWGGG